MKSNRIIWGIVALVVLVTIAVSFGTVSYSQKEVPKEQNNNPFGDLSKYPVAEYNAPESTNATEREERKLKNKRYDKKLLVIKNPGSEDIASIVSDAEPLSPAIPFAESSLIVIGKIQNSKASLSNDKSGVYSEYGVQLQTILKDDNTDDKLRTGETVIFDRTGGVVQYPNGQKMLYLNDWQNLPEIDGHYLIFLINDDPQNTNYRLLTAYQIKDGKVTALDNHPSFSKFNGMIEADFLKLVFSKK